MHTASPTTTQTAMSAAVVAVARFRAVCSCSNADSDRVGSDARVEVASAVVDEKAEVRGSVMGSCGSGGLSTCQPRMRERDCLEIAGGESDACISKMTRVWTTVLSFAIVFRCPLWGGEKPRLCGRNDILPTFYHILLTSAAERGVHGNDLAHRLSSFCLPLASIPPFCGYILPSRVSVQSSYMALP